MPAAARGRPKGTTGPNGPQKGRLFAHTLEVELNKVNPRDPQGRKNLFTIAEKLVEEANNGEAWAINAIMDRVDGRPAQQINHADNEGGKLIAGIQVTFVKPDEKE